MSATRPAMRRGDSAPQGRRPSRSDRIGTRARPRATAAVDRHGQEGLGPRRPASSLCVDPGESRREVRQELGEGERGRCPGAADQDVVPSNVALLCQYSARYLAQPALCAIARDSVADLLGAGEAYTDTASLTIQTRAGLEGETGGWRTQGRGRADKIRALRQNLQVMRQAQRTLRPRARRRFRTARPFFVAMRARKP